MKQLNNIQFDDFYFNNAWASSYGLSIAGKNGISPFSILPSEDRKTEKILGRHGELLVNRQWNPRTWTVPVVANDLSKIRDIAGWLANTGGIEQDFYFKNDTVKIKCLLDIQPVDTESYIMDSLLAGVFELKFISYSTFYQDINDNKYITQPYTRLTNANFIDPLTMYNPITLTQYNKNTIAPIENIANIVDITTLLNDNTKIFYTDGLITKNGNAITLNQGLTSVKFWNNGNQQSFPLIKINGSGNIVAAINGQSISMNNINSWIYIDMNYMTVYKDITDLSTNQILDYVGNFITLQNGWNSISVSSGNVTNIEIQCNSLYI